MAEEKIKRRLAAILAADIAGYSRLMGEDEAATVRDLKGHQGVVLPLVGEFGGRIIDTAGDGIMAEFPSVVGAVECAMEIQKLMAARNQDVPESRRMQFRVGINLGDVIHDETRIYGDGINVAARLENIAEPGGICISSKVHDEIVSKLALSYRDLGEQELKNISRPVRVYALSPESSGAEEAGGIDALLEQKARLDQLAKDKFRRLLTVMFTDLKGSTALAEPEGDIASRIMTKRHLDLVAEAIRENQGTLVKTIGDGTLSHFTDAQSALRAAVRLQRGVDEFNLTRKAAAPLLVRVGMHTGGCILEKNDIVGDIVDMASRFESSANAGEILISEDTYRALTDKSEIYCRFHKQVMLKGKSEPFNAYKAFWDPKEVEHDKAGPAVDSAPKARPPLWKLALMIGVPVLVVLAVSLFAGSRDKLDSESRRSVIHSLPAK